MWALPLSYVPDWICRKVLVSIYKTKSEFRWCESCLLWLSLNKGAQGLQFYSVTSNIIGKVTSVYGLAANESVIWWDPFYFWSLSVCHLKRDFHRSSSARRIITWLGTIQTSYDVRDLYSQLHDALSSPLTTESVASQKWCNSSSRVRSAVESGICMGVRLARNIATVKMGYRSWPLL